MVQVELQEEGLGGGTLSHPGLHKQPHVVRTHHISFFFKVLKPVPKST